jgi:hypothetical protein
MTATYKKRGLHFLYPDNWKLIDEAESDLPSSISVESPDGNAFWSVHLYEPDSDPDELLKEMISNLTETYPDLEVSPFEGDFPARVSSGLEVMFYCLDFLIRVRLQAISTPQYQMVMWFQAEDRDFDKIELVFKAISLSLLQGLDRRNHD